MILKRISRYAALIMAAALAASAFSGCGGSADTSADTEEEEKTAEAQTLTVSDPEYYTKFKDAGISINVYNWGEYISTGAEAGTLDVNSEFTKLCHLQPPADSERAVFVHHIDMQAVIRVVHAVAADQGKQQIIQPAHVSSSPTW